MSLSRGTRLGSHEIGAPLGVGGMGEGIFTYSGQVWDITESRFAEIERDVRGLIDDYVRLCESDAASRGPAV